ncbi:MAG: hypothetical protein HZC01_03525 [Candidatus Kerfeldbacteria bacterium]|nr:hypothetical protein [Candidatus Kerfeldbacteria bacterium]
MNQEDRNTFGTVISDPRKPEDGDKTRYVAFRVEKDKKSSNGSRQTKLVIALGQSATDVETYFKKGSKYGIDPSVKPLNAKVYSDTDPNLESCLEYCVIVIDEPQSGDAEPAEKGEG